MSLSESQNLKVWWGVVTSEKTKNTPTYIILTLNEAAVFARDMFRDNLDCWYYLYAKAVDC